MTQLLLLPDLAFLTPDLAFFSPGPWEIGILVALILLILFGNRVPQLARNLGRSIVEFKSGLSDDKPGDKDSAQDKDDSLRG